MALSESGPLPYRRRLERLGLLKKRIGRMPATIAAATGKMRKSGVNDSFAKRSDIPARMGPTHDGKAEGFSREEPAAERSAALSQRGERIWRGGNRARRAELFRRFNLRHVGLETRGAAEMRMCEKQPARRMPTGTAGIEQERRDRKSESRLATKSRRLASQPDAGVTLTNGCRISD